MAKVKAKNKAARTRKDLLIAASKLLREGNTPTIEEVASEALVSRATAYRYFASIEELLTEAPIETEVPDAEQLFKGHSQESAAERVDRAEAVMHEMAYRNEGSLRRMLINTLKRSANGERDPEVPLRQNRRTTYIETALAPYRKELTPEIYKKLCATLALIFGTESMIVFRDVLPLDPERARKIKSWAIKTLVQGAFHESKRAARESKTR